MSELSAYEVVRAILDVCGVPYVARPSKRRQANMLTAPRNALIQWRLRFGAGVPNPPEHRLSCAVCCRIFLNSSPEALTCSPKCNAIREAKGSKYYEYTPRPLKKHACEVCGKASMTKASGRKHCSKRCSYIARTGGYKRKFQPCASCGGPKPDSVKALTYCSDTCERTASRASKYKLSTRQLLALVEAQSGLCAVCGAPEGTALKIDHCHATGAVRGLLCHGCNCALGFMRDDAERMRRAAEYIDRHRVPDTPNMSGG